MHNIYVTLSHIRSFNGVVLLQDIIIQDICRANFKKMSLEMTYAVKSKIEQMNIPTCHNVSQPHFWKECEDDSHTPEMGTWESSGTPKTSEFDCKAQNTSPGGVLYIIEKLSKCRCRKWPCMSHFDI